MHLCLEVVRSNQFARWELESGFFFFAHVPLGLQYRYVISILYEFLCFFFLLKKKRRRKKKAISLLPIPIANLAYPTMVMNGGREGLQSTSVLISFGLFHPWRAIFFVVMMMMTKGLQDSGEEAG